MNDRLVQKSSQKSVWEKPLKVKLTSSVLGSLKKQPPSGDDKKMPAPGSKDAPERVTKVVSSKKRQKSIAKIAGNFSKKEKTAIGPSRQSNRTRAKDFSPASSIKSGVSAASY